MAPQYGQRKRYDNQENHESQMQGGPTQRQPNAEEQSDTRETMHRGRLSDPDEKSRFRFDAPKEEFEHYGEGFNHGPAYAFPDYGYYARGQGHGNTSYTPWYYGGGSADEQRRPDYAGDFGKHTHHAHHGDPDYSKWREEQIRNLDRDYEEYRKARNSHFAEEFNQWRSARLGGKDSDGKK